MGTYPFLGRRNSSMGGKNHLAASTDTEDNQNHDTCSNRRVRALDDAIMTVLYLEIQRPALGLPR